MLRAMRFLAGIFLLSIFAFFVGQLSSGWVPFSSVTGSYDTEQAAAVSVSNFADFWCDVRAFFLFPCEVKTPASASEYAYVENKDSSEQVVSLATSTVIIEKGGDSNITNIYPLEREVIREVVVQGGAINTSNFVTRSEYERQVEALLRSIENNKGNTTIVQESSGGGGGAIDSVNGQTGVVILDTDDVTEATNQYFTTSRGREVFATNATGLSYATSTGILSLAAGYNIPLTASTSEWSTAFGWGDHSSAGYIEPNTSATLANLVLTGSLTASLIDGCVEVAGGVFTSTGSNCGVGGGGIANLNGLTTSSQTFATSSNNGLTLTITSSAGVHTFAPNLVSGYSIPLTASTSEWSTAFGWSDHSLEGYLTEVASSTVRNMFGAGTGLSYSTTTGQFTNTGVTSLGGLTGDVSTSSLGLGNNTFLNLIDTPSSYTSNRIPFTNSAGDALTDSANLTFDDASDLLSISGSLTTGFGLGLTNAGAIFASEDVLSPGAGITIFGNEHVSLRSDSAFVSVRYDGVDSFTSIAGDGVQIYSHFDDININSTNNIILSSIGSIGIGTTTPSSKLTIAGDMFLTGAFRDSANLAGTAGYILQTTGSGTSWVATSSLGIVSGSSYDQDLNTSNNVSFNTLSITGTGTSTFFGNIEMSGSIIPSADITYDLGSETRQWKDVYIGPGSLYINGKKVIQDVSDTIVVSTDIDQNLRMETSGLGNATLRATSTGNVVLTTSSGNININSVSGNLNIGTTGSGLLNLGTINSGVWHGTDIDISDYTNLTVSATGLELSGDSLALASGYTIPLIASTTEWSNKLTNITGLITAGSNISLTGNGTAGDPYVINSTATSTGGGAGGMGNPAFIFSSSTAGSNIPVNFTGLPGESPVFSAGTLKLPSDTTAIVVEVWGAGGGGGGGGVGSGNGTTGGTSCFGTNGTACTTPMLQATGGAGGDDGAGAVNGSNGGIGSGGDVNIVGSGGAGSGAATGGTSWQTGGAGGNAPRGGGGGGAGFSGAGDAGGSFGGGGGGGGLSGTSGSAAGGGGGAGGGYSQEIVRSPSGTYYYTIGAGGAGGAGGTDGYLGATGGAGGIVITVYTASQSSGYSGGTASSSVAFSVHKNGTNQTVAASIWTKLNWTNKEFDTNNNFSTSTGRFTPTVAGKYLISLTIYCIDSTGYCDTSVYKNGSALHSSVSSSGTGQSSVTTAVVSMNGTTDYIEGYTNNGGGTTIAGDTQFSYFSGALIAPASAIAGGWSNDATQSYLADNSDLVAIGTTTAAAKLDVWGNVGSQDILGISSSTGSRLLTLTAGGNLGIGTTTPSSKLTVAGSAAFELFNTSSTTATSTIAGNLQVNGQLKVGTSSLYLNSESIMFGLAAGLRLEDGKLQFKHADGEWADIGSGTGTGGGTTQYGLMESEWVDTGSDLPGGLAYSQTAIIGDYVYLFGGYSSSYTNVIYRAPVSDPTDWENTGATLPSNLAYSQTAIIGDYVYLFGGNNGSYTNVIYRAPVSNPTSWTNTGSTLPGNLGISQTAIIGDYVYLFGGVTGSGYTNVIYRAPVSNPTSWTNTGSTLPGNLGISQVAVIGDYVYLFGGHNGSAYQNVIYRAPVSNPTSWSNTGKTLPASFAYSQVAVIGDYVYLFGGNGGTVLNTIYRAPVSNPTSWSNTGTTLPVTLEGPHVAVINNQAYLFGGHNGSSWSNAIYRAPIYTGAPSYAGNRSWKVQGNAGDGVGGGSSDIAGLLAAGTGVSLAGGGTAGNPYIISTGGATSTVAFSVHKNGTVQTGLLANDYNLVTWSTERFDTNNNFASNRFTPTVAGKYMVTTNTGCGGATVCQAHIYKNGTVIAGGNYSSSASAPSYSSVTTIVDMNGTGDYLEVWTYTNSTSIVGESRITHFSGALIAPASAIAGGWSNDATQSYLADNSDLVAIGTTTAAAKLDVWGNVGSQDIFRISSSTGARILTVGANGNIGIGTTTPSSKLTVSGSASFDFFNTSSTTATSTIAGNLQVNGQLKVGTSSLYLDEDSIMFGLAAGLRLEGGKLQFKHADGEWSDIGSGTGIGGGTTQYGLMESEWVDTGADLPGNLSFSQTAVIGDYVYLFGGNNGSYTNVIYRAPVSNPTSWTNTGATIPGNLGNSQTAIIGDYVYLFGGNNGSYTNVIYRAPVSNPTSWTNTGSTLPGNLSSSQLAVIGDYVYLFGGRTTGDAFTNTIYRAPVSNPTSWTNTGSTLPGNLGMSQTAVIGDYVYLFGGSSNVIYRAPVSNPTSWTNTGATLPTYVDGSQIAIIGDYVYLFGGYTTSISNVIYRAPINNPTSWTNTGRTLPSNLIYTQSAIIDDYIYLFGGSTGSLTSNIYRAPIYTGAPSYAGNSSWKVQGNSGNGVGGGSGDIAGLLAAGTGISLAGAGTAGNPYIISTGGATSTVAFSVHKNGTHQTVTGASWNKLSWSTEEFDTNNNFSTSTGRFTPTVAGKYIVNLSAYCGGAVTCYVSIYKNGAGISQAGQGSVSSTLVNTNIVLDMNGTTDYLEGYAFSDSTTIEGARSSTNFSGALIAPASAIAGGWSNDATQSYLADNSDLVAIGTTTAAAKLDVWGNTGSSDIFRISSSTGARILTVGANGNVGIGTTSSLAKLDVWGTAGSQDIFAISSSTGSRLLTLTAAGNLGIGTTTTSSKFTIQGTAGSQNIFSVASSVGAPLFTVAAAGNVSIGTTGPSYSGKVTSYNALSYTYESHRTGTGAEGHVVFVNGNGPVGTIFTNGSATSYNTTSDRRVKNNIDYTKLGLDDLMQLPVRDFSFITDEDGEITTGFIAQELYEVFPWAVTTNGDNGFDLLTGSSTPWSVDYGRVTPLLVKSIQDLNLKLEDLASSTVATSSLNALGEEEQTFVGRFFARMVEWFADATNGIGTMVAKTFLGSELCLKDDSGTTCYTRADLNAAVSGQTVNQHNSSNIQPAATDICPDLAGLQTDPADCVPENNTETDLCPDMDGMQITTEDCPPTSDPLECAEGETLDTNTNQCVADAPAPIVGCMDPLATNYNPEANEDSGSCEFPPEEPAVPPATTETGVGIESSETGE